MKRHLITSTLALALMSIVFASCNKVESGRNVKDGDTLPEFSVTMNNGDVITNKSFDNRNGLIVFFNTSCIDCQKELPTLQALYEKYNNKALFCLISREEGESSIRDYWSANKLTLPYSAQTTRDVYNLFANIGIPLSYFIEKGKVTRMWSYNPLPTYELIETVINDSCIEITFGD